MEDRAGRQKESHSPKRQGLSGARSIVAARVHLSGEPSQQGFYAGPVGSSPTAPALAALDRLPAEVDALEPGITERVAAWAATLRYEDIPEPVLMRARLQVASVLGAIIATSRSDLHPRLVRAASRWGHGDQASIIPSGPRSPLHAACYVNAAASTAYDFDDYLFA
jgi:hypothetical protein